MNMKRKYSQDNKKTFEPQIIVNKRGWVEFLVNNGGIFIDATSSQFSISSLLNQCE